jgi:hypothetical protein
MVDSCTCGLVLVSAAAWALSSALHVAVTERQESGSVVEGEGATATLGVVVGAGVAVDAGDGEVVAAGVGVGATGHALDGKDVGHPCVTLHWVTSFLQAL